MKNFKWLFVAFLMFNVVFCDGMVVNAESSVEYIRSGDFSYYELKDGTVSIVEYYGTDESVLVPAEIDGKKISEVGGFKNCYTMKHLIIQEGITELVTGAFENCSNLTDITIPSSVKGIKRSVFSECSKLSNVKLPEGLTEIGDKAFFNCSSLSQIDLPSSLKLLYYSAFEGCNNLLSINVNSDNKFFSSKDGVLYNKDMTILHICPSGKKYIEIPQSVKTLGNRAFSNCNNLTSIFIPCNVKVIEGFCFNECLNLESVEIENGVERLENGVFCYCKSLTKIMIPDSVISISKIRTFDGCNSLTIYANPESYARVYADNEKIRFNCLKHLWDEGIITLEPTVTNEGTKLFTCKTCKTNKTEKIAKLPLPQTGNTITNSDDSYKVTKSGRINGTVKYLTTKKSKTTITIPDTVTIDGITYKVTAVSKNAFKNNKKLKKIIVGKNINKIEAGVFYGCKNLKMITVKSTKLKSVGKNVFKGIHKNAKIKVPAGKLKKYKKLLGKKGQKSTVKIVM